MGRSTQTLQDAADTVDNEGLGYSIYGYGLGPIEDPDYPEEAKRLQELIDAAYPLLQEIDSILEPFMP